MDSRLLSSPVEIESIAAGGEGVGRLPDGRPVFVHRTAPGDQAVVDITRQAKRWARGTLQSLTSPSDQRRDAPCVLYDRCGGCQLQHLPYEQQLSCKRDFVDQALRRIGHVEGASEPVVPSPYELSYRSRATFMLRRMGGGRVWAGFHELHRPGRILDVGAECLLLSDELRLSWEQLRAGWGPFAVNLPGGGRLRLTLRQMDNGAMLVVHGGRDAGRPDHLLAAVPRLCSVWWAPKRRPARLLAGVPLGRARRGGVSFQLGPAAFLQANRGAADELWDIVTRQIGPVRGKHVIDGYAGVGVYGRALAELGARVTAIELNADAVEAARRDAPATLEVVEARVEEALPDVLPADLVLLNPPRGGLDARVPVELCAMPVPRVVYVSCDPATLARDAARLDPVYRLTRVQPVDLFPQTAHVEIVATFDAVSPQLDGSGEATA